MALQTDVLIVGGGPVGLALALDLRYRGVSVVLVEASDGEVSHPKVSTVGPRSMELFRRWGVAKKIRAAGWPGDYPLDVAWVTRVGGHEIYRLDRGTADSRPLPAHTPEPDQICPAHWLTPLLMREAGPVRTRCRLDGFSQDDDRVLASVTDLATETPLRIETRFMVACDGASSRVRTACGIGAPPRYETQVFRNILFRAPRLREQLGPRTAMVYFLLRSSELRFPLRCLDGRELYNLVVSGETDLDAASLVTSAIALDTPVETLSDGEWHLTHRVADRFRAGRVFLVGDAAHTLSPSGGFGMSTGICGAADLGWKLAAELGGWAGPRLLDSYHDERRPVAVDSLEEARVNLRRTMARELPGELDHDTPEGERARAEMARRLEDSGVRHEFDAPKVHFGYRYASPLVVPDGEPPADGEWRQTTVPGSRAPHAWLAPGVSTLDLFGPGFTLLHFTGSDRLPGFERAFAERRVPLAVSRCADPAVAALYERPFVLVRPDGHVAWRGTAPPADPAELADRVRGARW
ncbi:FAD-dependent monooxygenase [Amycolatopsis sp. NPDC059021]|uniref:FAD-dependent monooxygenase n=1 Tax=Amycolatopsis sp. NPDC059021 TaxID=3346704 RepID=UPI003672FAC2